MHPAYSVILFTTSSGAGYGLLFWLGLFTTLGANPLGRWASLIALTIALVLVTVGLLASTLHLGHPERAWRAFSQWRSSWLSREGVIAVATYVPAGIWWLMLATGLSSGVFMGLAAAIGAVATVWCTGMIYGSLRTIRHWNRPDVAPIYVALAAATGAILYGAIISIAGGSALVITIVALLALAVGFLMKSAYWRGVDSDPGQYTTEMATGLGHLGDVRPLDPPHTQPNFVMREMGYHVARKHAATLRMLVLTLLFAAPFFLLLLALAFGASAVFFVITTILVACGVVVERWLFFAEAEHVSMLYYGEKRA
ncbi:MAG: DmsC/YnfH family molybdoenzyme membrane anchor subunit [Pseudomonadota bacterium]